MSEFVENNRQEETLSGQDLASLSEELHEAARFGNAKKVRSWLANYAALFEELKLNVMSTASYEAERGGHTEVVNILKPYCSRSAGGRLLLFTCIPVFGINFICGLYILLMKKKTPTGKKIYKYGGFSRIVALIGVIAWAAVLIYFAFID